MNIVKKSTFCDCAVTLMLAHRTKLSIPASALLNLMFIVNFSESYN
jgi:hypothetical protein